MCVCALHNVRNCRGKKLIHEICCISNRNTCLVPSPHESLQHLLIYLVQLGCLKLNSSEGLSHQKEHLIGRLSTICNLIGWLNTISNLIGTFVTDAIPNV